jgi:hypothetical protein
MSVEDIKAKLQAELPALLQQDAGFRAWLEDLIRRTAVSVESFDARFDRILRELAADREAQARKWDEQTEQWKEDSRRWDEQNRQLQEDSRRWDEQNEKWKENSRRLDEQNRKWHEQTEQWKENSRRWEEENEKWKEDSRRWNEHNRQLQEDSRRWEEQNAKWKEDSRRWDEQNRKWDEQTEQRKEDSRRWDEQNRKWDEQNQKWHEQQRFNEKVLDELRQSRVRQEQALGAIGARWGLASEASFRAALKGILEQSFGVEVINVNEFDDEGTVFGAPDQVEIDIIVRNGELILCELKSSMSKSDIYTFERKVQFYQRRHGRSATRKIVVSPMVRPEARPVAERLGIEVFGSADEVPER